MLAKWTREHLRYYLVRDNGRQTALIYVYENGCYRLYAPEMLKDVIKQYIAEYDERLVRMGVVNEAFNQIMTDLNYIPQDDLDADETIINFDNGILHLDDMTLYAHNPCMLIYSKGPCSDAPFRRGVRMVKAGGQQNHRPVSYATGHHLRNGAIRKG